MIGTMSAKAKFTVKIPFMSGSVITDELDITFYKGEITKKSYKNADRWSDAKIKNRIEKENFSKVVDTDYVKYMLEPENTCYKITNSCITDTNISNYVVSTVRNDRRTATEKLGYVIKGALKLELLVEGHLRFGAGRKFDEMFKPLNEDNIYDILDLEKVKDLIEEITEVIYSDDDDYAEFTGIQLKSPIYDEEVTLIINDNSIDIDSRIDSLANELSNLSYHVYGPDPYEE